MCVVHGIILYIIYYRDISVPGDSAGSIMATKCGGGEAADRRRRVGASCGRSSAFLRLPVLRFEYFEKFAIEKERRSTTSSEAQILLFWWDALLASGWADFARN